MMSLDCLLFWCCEHWNGMSATMPKCEGRPSRLCPTKVNDKTVKLSQGYLLLCSAWDTFHFGASLELKGNQPTDSVALKKSTLNSTKQPKVIHTIDTPTELCGTLPGGSSTSLPQGYLRVKRMAPAATTIDSLSLTCAQPIFPRSHWLLLEDSYDSAQGMGTNHIDCWSPWPQRRLLTRCSFSPFTPAKVLYLINKSYSKSSPMNFIPSSLIKSCAYVFSELVSHLANLSIFEGIFPSKFKLAQFTPFLKNLVLTKTLLVITGLSPT